MATVQFNIKGMSCAGCARSIERRLSVTPGVRTSSVDLDAGTTDIDYDETVTDPGSLEKIIEALGFDVLHGMGSQS